MMKHYKFCIKGNVRAGYLKRLREASIRGYAAHLLECSEKDWSQRRDEDIVPHADLTLEIVAFSQEDADQIVDQIGNELCVDEYELELLRQ
jgi:hypothetical protein